MLGKEARGHLPVQGGCFPGELQEVAMSRLARASSRLGCFAGGRQEQDDGGKEGARRIGLDHVLDLLRLCQLETRVWEACDQLLMLAVPSGGKRGSVHRGKLLARRVIQS